MAHKKQTDVSPQDKSYRPAATIDMLVDDALLDIFDFYRTNHDDRLHTYPRPVWDWCLLAHVCRRWRQIIFGSPHRLKLQILCTYGTPVRENLGIWPALPIVIQLCSERRHLRPQNKDQVIAALEHRDRVYSVSLLATTSQLAEIAAAMQQTFHVLTHLYMGARSADPSALTAEFLGGSAPHLQEIILCSIPFPALPTLLSSTSALVTLRLAYMLLPVFLSPESVVACLAVLPRLKSFTIMYFQVTSRQDSRPDRIQSLPVTRPILPALTDFEFRGAFDYLEDVVAQIDSPQLERISIYYLYDPSILEVTHPLSDFIDRSIGPDSPPRRAHVHLYYNRVTFTLSREQPHASYSGCDGRSVATTESFNCAQLDVARVLGRFSAVLCTVVHLNLEAELKETSHPEYAYYINWLHLLRQFPAMQTLHVSLKLAAPVCLAEDIRAEQVAEVCPSLWLICLEGAPVSSLEKIVALRRFSDHPITVVETTEEFNERLESYGSR